MADSTVGRLLDDKRPVRWVCDVAASHFGDVDLAALVLAQGRDFDLTDRHPPCRISGCPGVVRFEDRTSQWPRALTALTDGDDAWWTHNEDRRRTLNALGWRCVMGEWVAP